VVGIAGASTDSPELWQIGIDIVADERRRGLGKAIVSRVAEAVLDAGIVPYYMTSVSNIASRNVAHGLGFWPAWTEIFAKHIRPAAT
jgi:predicted GNAT family acetyltransferase